MAEFGVPTDEQLIKTNQLAKRTLSKDEVFVFSGKSAGDLMIPKRYTRLGPEFLQVLADDAKKGVSFMYNHNWSGFTGLQGVPYGKVFDGNLSPSACEGETTELHLTKYIVRDDEAVDGMSANALIKKIETGILSDTSIGFSTDILECSICKNNYYSRDCRHYRGCKYEMGDGTQKVCTVTAMPPSVIIPYNNNALFEESIVWDGAYPGAIVTQSKHGDIIETPSGKFSILDEKEELPENTPIIGRYHNGNIVTMVKKENRKKVFQGAKVEDENLKGGEKMDEKTIERLKALGIEYKVGETTLEELIDQISEKLEQATAETELQEAEGEPTLSVGDVVFPKDYMKKTFGKELSADELEKFVKEGQEYHKSLSNEAIAMGVRAMGNDFPKETWEKSFSAMDTKAIKDIMATWELQAKADIPAGRKTDPEASKERAISLPDEAHKVGN